jgi:hypothetical protein
MTNSSKFVSPTAAHVVTEGRAIAAIAIPPAGSLPLTQLAPAFVVRSSVLPQPSTASHTVELAHASTNCWYIPRPSGENASKGVETLTLQVGARSDAFCWAAPEQPDTARATTASSTALRFM